MKRVVVEGMFPELKGRGIYAQGRGEGSNVKAATARAFGDLLKQKQVRGKRIHVIKATISIIDVKPEQEGTSVQERSAVPRDHGQPDHQGSGTVGLQAAL